MNITDIRSKYPQYSDMSDDQLVDAFHQKFYSDLPRADVAASMGVKPAARSDFTDGAKAALGETPAIAKGVVGLLGATAEQATGEGGVATAVKNWGLRGYQEGMQKLEPLRQNASLTDAWEKAKGGDLGALVDWAQYGLGYSLGQLGETAAVAALGGLAGTAAAGPVGTVGGSAAGLLAKGASKTLAVEAIEKAVSKQAAEIVAQSAGKVALEEATKQATKNVAREIGSTAALGTWGVGQEAGSIYADAEEQAAKEGRKLDGADLARVWGASLAAGGVEAFTDKLGLDALSGKVRLPGAGGAVARGVTGAAALGAGEAGTEALQTAIERVGSGQALTGADATKDYIDSAGLGFVGGAAAGGFAGARHGPAPVAPPAKSPEQIASEQGLDAERRLGEAKTVDDMISAASDLANLPVPPITKAPVAPPAPEAPKAPTTSVLDSLETPAYAEADQQRLAALQAQLDAGQMPQGRTAAQQATPEQMATGQEQSLARRAAGQVETVDRSGGATAGQWVDLTPRTDMAQAQQELARLRERAPEFGVNPHDMVLALHPEVPGAIAVKAVANREPPTIQGPTAPVSRTPEVQTSPNNAPQRAFIDRQATLQQQGATSLTAFDRDSALQQAQTQRDTVPKTPDTATRTAAGAPVYVDLKPMTQREAANRLVVLRDMAQSEGRDPAALVAVAHPTAKGMLAIRDTGPMIVDQPARDAGVSIRADDQGRGEATTTALVDQRLDAADREGQRVVSRRDDLATQMEQQGYKRAQQAVEQRNGVASPEEAAILDAASPKVKLYDRIDSTLGDVRTVDQRLSDATGIDVTGDRNLVKNRRVPAEPQDAARDHNGPDVPVVTGNRRGGVDLPEGVTQDQARLDRTATERSQDTGAPVVEAPEAPPVEQETPKERVLRRRRELRQKYGPMMEGMTAEENAEMRSMMDEAGAYPAKKGTLEGHEQRLPKTGDRPDLGEAVRARDTKGVLAALRVSKNPVIQRIGEMAHQLGDKLTFEAWPTEAELGKWKVKINGEERSMSSRNVGGLYHPSRDAITLREARKLRKGPVSSLEGHEDLVAHEIMHAITSWALDNPTAEQRPAVEALRALFEHVKAKLPDAKDYGLNNIHEFMSEGFMNPEFQHKLAQVKYGNASAWSKFTRLVAKLLGFREGNAFTELLTLGEDLASKPRRSGQFLPGESPQASVAPEATSKAEEMHGADDYTDAQRRALSQVFGDMDSRSAKQKVLDTPKKIGAWFKNRFVQQVVDQFSPLRAISKKAYMLARMSAGDGGFEALLLYGTPKVDADGAIYLDKDDKSGGVAKMLAELGGEHQRFLQWVAAQRAEQLMALDKERRFSKTSIEALKTLDAGEMDDGRSRPEVYAQALQDLNRINDAVLAVAEASGMLDPRLREYLKDMPYVPFYRVMEDDSVLAPHQSSALTGQELWHKISGGSSPLHGDLLANALQNWGHVLVASAKNRAATEAVHAMVERGYASQVGYGDGGVRLKERGQNVYYKIAEDRHDLAEALSAMHYAIPEWMKPLNGFKRALTFGVTSLPGFKVKNLIRDSLQAPALAEELHANGFKNATRGLELADFNGAAMNLMRSFAGKGPALGRAQSDTFVQALAGGGLMRFGSQVEGNRASHAEKAIKRARGVVLDAKGGRRLLQVLGNVAHAYNELGDTSEQANRLALYEQMIKNGSSHLEASFAARDLMDFSMQGKAPAIRFLVHTVPFLNARLQGLYKLASAATTGDQKRLGLNKRFVDIAGAVTAVSLGLMLIHQDDDDWKEREDWDRDTYWWFKVGGTAYRIPKPFEVGSIGTLAERTWEALFNKDMTARRYGKELGHMLLQTFAMDPTPQAVKPLIEIWANKDSFNGRAIETQAEEKLRPEDRYSEKTSMVARWLGQAGLPDPTSILKGDPSRLSPEQIDHLLKGYFGGLATVLTGMVDVAAKPGQRPDMTAKALTSSFVDTLPADQSRYVTALYERANEAAQAQASYRAALALGDPKRALEIFQEERDKIGQASFLTGVRGRLATINKAIRQIEANETLSGEEKRAKLENFYRVRNMTAKMVEQALPAR